MKALPTLIPTLCPELLDAIASQVSHPRDLAQFALAHPTFQDIVSPIHIDHRVIECTIDDGKMWDMLEANPRCIRNIRFLKLHVKPMYDAPSIRRNPPGGSGLYGRRMLPLKLLERMSHLQSFEWLGVNEQGPQDETLAPVRHFQFNFLFGHACNVSSRCVTYSIAKKITTIMSLRCGEPSPRRVPN